MDIDYTFTKITNETNKMIEEFSLLYDNESKGRKLKVKDLKHVETKKIFH